MGVSDVLVHPEACGTKQKCAGPSYVVPSALLLHIRGVWGLPSLALQVQTLCGAALWSLVPLVLWFLGMSLCQSGHLCKQPVLSVWPLKASAVARPLCVHVLGGKEGGYIKIPLRRILENIYMHDIKGRTFAYTDR